MNMMKHSLLSKIEMRNLVEGTIEFTIPIQHLKFTFQYSFLLTGAITPGGPWPAQTPHLSRLETPTRTNPLAWFGMLRNS